MRSSITLMKQLGVWLFFSTFYWHLFYNFCNLNWNRYELSSLFKIFLLKYWNKHEKGFSKIFTNETYG